MQKKVRKAIFPVAGLGTRFLPATKSSPKEMLPLIDKPLVQYVVEEAVASGIEQIIFVTGRTKRAIEDHFDSSPELELHLEEKGKDSTLQEVRDIADMVDIFYGEDIVFSLVHELDADEIIVYGDLHDDEATDHYVLN